MSKSFRLAAFALLVLGASVAFADMTGPAGFPYSTTAFATNQAAACSSAASAVASHCPIHGTITTEPHGCLRMYNAQLEFIGYICSCEASTSWCQLFAPPGGLHP